MKHSAEITIDEIPSSVLIPVLSPEVDDIDGKARSRIKQRGDETLVEITAPDVVSLRAGFNMWMKLIETAIRIHKADT